MRLVLPLLPLAFAAGCGEAPGPQNMSAAQVAEELAEISIEPGLWQLTSEIIDVRAPGLPVEVRNRMIGPRSQMRNCITPEQAAQPSANFLAMRSDSECVYRDFSLDDGRLRGTMACPGVTATMAGRYQPNGYETRRAMESAMPGGATMTLQIRARGRRIGECDEGKAK